MKKIITFLAITVLCIGLSTSLLAQEKGSISLITAVTKNAKDKLKTDQTIAIFLSGNDSLLIRILEDALAIHLANEGFTIVNRELLEKGVGEEVARKKKEKKEGTINALEIGKAVNADSILTGTVIIESGEEKSLLIKIASFQFVDVASGKTLLSILFESERGRSFSETAQSFVEIIKQSME